MSRSVATFGLVAFWLATACSKRPARLDSELRLLEAGRVRVLESASTESRAMRVHGDGRPSLVLGVPARLRMPVRIPKEGRLAFSLVIRPIEAMVRVALEVREGSQVTTAYDERWQGARGWSNRRLDLAAWAGRSVDLELSAEGPAGATIAVGQPEILARTSVPRPNVLIYLVDCLRADHVGAYGYTRATTPSIDALAADGVRFDRAYACSGWTKGSLGCLFTSLYPAEHGARGIDGVLDPSRTTLAEVFRTNRYLTAALVANPIVDEAFGFARGFDRFVQFSREFVGKAVNSVNTDAAELSAALRPFLEENRDRRFFLYVHSLDLHFPYSPKPPYDRAFAGPSSSTPLDLYDGELLGNDHEIGVLVGELKRLGLYDDTLIVITADHGEEFGEHGYDRHGHTLFDTLLHVPWILKLPGSAERGRRVETPVSNLDFGPTLLSLAGLAAPAAFEGLDLSGAVRGDPVPAPSALYAEQIGARDTVYSVRRAGLKYIQRLLPEPETLLFDVARDPAEQNNLLPTEAARAAPLASDLLRFIQKGQRGYHVLLDGGAVNREIEIVATTSAHFREALRLTVRTGETLVLDPDRQRLVCRYVADGEPRHLVLSTEPEGAPVQFGFRVGGSVLRPGAVDLGRGRHPHSVPFEINASQLASGPAPVIDSDSGGRLRVQLWQVGGPARGPLDGEAREALRALGYVQ